MQGFQIVLERKGDDIFKNIFNCFRKKTYIACIQKSLFE